MNTINYSLGFKESDKISVKVYWNRPCISEADIYYYYFYINGSSQGYIKEPKKSLINTKYDYVHDFKADSGEKYKIQVKWRPQLR